MKLTSDKIFSLYDDTIYRESFWFYKPTVHRKSNYSFIDFSLDTVISKHDQRRKVSLYGSDINVPNQKLPVYTYNIEVSVYDTVINDWVSQHKDVYYSVNGKCYSTELADVISAREVAFKRFYNNSFNAIKINRIKVRNLSNKTLRYIRNAVEKKFDCERSHDYAIRDIYFSYNGNKRNLTVVIKHKNNDATEAFYFTPSKRI